MFSPAAMTTKHLNETVNRQSRPSCQCKLGWLSFPRMTVTQATGDIQIVSFATRGLDSQPPVVHLVVGPAML